MVDRDTIVRYTGNENLRHIAFTAAIFSLPAISGELALTWAVPLSVFYSLGRFGRKRGSVVIAAGMFVAGLLTAFSGTLPALLVSFTLAPLGYILAQGLWKNESPTLAGIRGALFVVLSWTAVGGLYAMAHQTNLYNDLLTGLDGILAETYKSLSGQADIPAEVLREIESGFKELRLLIPKIFPAILINTAISIVWLNIVLGHWLLKSRDASLTPWNNFKEWRLPDQLVWGVIVAGAGFLLPVGLFKTMGLNGLLILGNLYFMQGLAVVSSLFVKWSIPRALKIIIYLLVLLQKYGVFLIAGLGLVDIWADFRKLRRETTE